MTRFFELRNKILNKKNRKDLNKPLRVIKCNEVEPILYMMHSYSTARNLGTDAIYYKIAEQYY